MRAESITTYSDSQTARASHLPRAGRERRWWPVWGAALAGSLALNAYFFVVHGQLQHERDLAVLKQDSTVSSKLVLERQLLEMRRMSQQSPRRPAVP